VVIFQRQKGSARDNFGNIALFGICYTLLYSAQNIEVLINF